MPKLFKLSGRILSPPRLAPTPRPRLTERLRVGKPGSVCGGLWGALPTGGTHRDGLVGRGGASRDAPGVGGPWCHLCGKGPSGCLPLPLLPPASNPSVLCWGKEDSPPSSLPWTGWRVGAGRPWPQHPDPRPSRRVKAGAPWVSLSKGPSLKPLPIRQALRGWLCHFTSTNPEYLLCAGIQRRIKPIHSFIHSFLRSSNKCQLSTCMCQAQSYAPGI